MFSHSQQANNDMGGGGTRLGWEIISGCCSFVLMIYQTVKVLAMLLPEASNLDPSQSNVPYQLKLHRDAEF